MSTVDVEKVPTDDATGSPLLNVTTVSKSFSTRLGARRAKVSAVENVSLSVRSGKTLGVVGESGCGKSTLARLVVGLLPVDSGEIAFDGTVLPKRRRSRKVVEQMQMVFQDPYSSLNPRASIGEAIAFPLQVQHVRRAEQKARVEEALVNVGLHSNYVSYYPHQLSGGQRQRVNIARALALRPRLVVLDEAVSALDKSIQAQILDLLLDLQDTYDLSYLFISHDLNVVEYMSDEIAVMYLGQLVETCSSEALYQEPLHPYTQVLLSSIPKLAPRTAKESEAPAGEMPSALNPPSGCRFRTRCPFATDTCAQRTPALTEVKTGHWVACHLYSIGDPTPAASGSPA